MSLKASTIKWSRLSVDRLSTSQSTSWSRLNRCLVDTRPTHDWHLVDSWQCDWLACIDDTQWQVCENELNLDRLFTEMSIECWLKIDHLSIDCRLKESTETDTADAFSKPDYDILNMLIHAFSSQLDTKMGFSQFNAGMGKGGQLQETTILDKINRNNKPPSSLKQWCREGTKMHHSCIVEMGEGVVQMFHLVYLHFRRGRQVFQQFHKVADIVLKAPDVTVFGARRRLTSTEGASYLGASGGAVSQKIFKIEHSETPGISFPARLEFTLEIFFKK